MSLTALILSHLDGEAAARKFLRDLEAGTALPGSLWGFLAALPEAQRHGACRLIEKALERAGRSA